MIRYPVIKVRLSPTETQKALLDKTFHCCRYLWNEMLSDVQEFYAATDIHYIPTPARYKKSAPFLKEVDSQALCAVHRNLRRAFLDFFRAPRTFRYPQFKSEKTAKNSFTVYCRQYRTGPSIQLTEDGIRMPKVGIIKANLYRHPERGWELKYVTVTKTRSGKYECSIVFKCSVTDPEPVIPRVEKMIGIQHSLIHFYADSEGNVIDFPAHLQKSQQRLRKLQSKLSRMQRGSKNYAEQAQKIRLLQEHIANQRKDFIHKESRRIADEWDAVCVQDTDLRELAQRLNGVAKVDNGFGMFRQCLQYKFAQQGKPFILIDRYVLTAKTCHKCGSIHLKLQPQETRWRCPDCGAELQRDVNAAKNTLDWGLVDYQDFRTRNSAL